MGSTNEKTVSNAALVAVVFFIASLVLWYFVINDDQSQIKSTRVAANTTVASPLLRAEKTSLPRITPLDDYEALVAAKDRLVVVDLSENEVKLFKNGREVDTVPIRSQGKVGSFWQTPTGLYTIPYANKNHVSSIGNVNMPYSLQYSGNFFIHGWPTYLNGEDVALGYSGGCVRLDTAGSKTVFDFAQVGDEVLVVNSSTTTKDSGLALDLANDDLPNLSTDSLLIANLSTGDVIAQQNQVPTKEMGYFGNFLLAMTANEWISYDTPVSQYVTNSSGYARTGSQLKPKALYPLLLQNNQSADAVNYALTRHRGSAFMATNVTDKIKAIGMSKSSLITDPASDQPFVFSAPGSDWFHLIRYLYYQKRFLLEISPAIESEKNNYVWQEATPTGSNIVIVKKFPGHDPIVAILWDSQKPDQDIQTVGDWVRQTS